jgi:hypothetical protein
VKGRWASGLEPRNFTWVFKNQLAVSERPGGSVMVHRKVRRDEELLWLRHNGFGRVMSVLPTNQELQIYTDHGLAISHHPLRGDQNQLEVILGCYQELHASLLDRHCVLLHGAEVSDRMLGIIAGFLMWSKRVASPPMAIAITEKLFERAIGPDGRSIVFQVSESLSD